MIPGFTIVSAATDGLYRAEIQRLIDSARQHGLTVLDHDMENHGSWVANCKQKAYFIRRALNAGSGPVVWLDADAEIVAYPALFDTLEGDIAYHRSDVGELLSGTLWFNRTETAMRIIEEWCAELNEEHGSNPREAWDQRCLDRALVRVPHTRTILPESYCHIFDKPVTDPPVIVHHQASRRFKRSMDRSLR